MASENTGQQPRPQGPDRQLPGTALRQEGSLCPPRPKLRLRGTPGCLQQLPLKLQGLQSPTRPPCSDPSPTLPGRAWSPFPRPERGSPLWGPFHPNGFARPQSCSGPLSSACPRWLQPCGLAWRVSPAPSQKRGHFHTRCKAAQSDGRHMGLRPPTFTAHHPSPCPDRRGVTAPLVWGSGPHWPSLPATRASL